MKNNIACNSKHRKLKVAILMSDKVDFKIDQRRWSAPRAKACRSWWATGPDFTLCYHNHNHYIPVHTNTYEVCWLMGGKKTSQFISFKANYTQSWLLMICGTMWFLGPPIVSKSLDMKPQKSVPFKKRTSQSYDGDICKENVWKSI